jgi:hypothetical protein
MRVTTNEAQDFSWDYALAWRMDAARSPVPVPAAVWLFATGALGILPFTRFRPAIQ